MKHFTTFCLSSFNKLWCNDYFYIGKLIEAMPTYDGVRNLGCAWLLFCLFPDFLWSRRIVDGLFVAFGFGRCGASHAIYIFGSLWKMTMIFKNSS
jgi:hypothetical protein